MTEYEISEEKQELKGNKTSKVLPLQTSKYRHVIIHKRQLWKVGLYHHSTGIDFTE